MIWMDPYKTQNMSKIKGVMENWFTSIYFIFLNLDRFTVFKSQYKVTDNTILNMKSLHWDFWGAEKGMD